MQRASRASYFSPSHPRPARQLVSQTNPLLLIRRRPDLAFVQANMPHICARIRRRVHISLRPRLRPPVRPSLAPSHFSSNNHRIAALVHPMKSSLPHIISGAAVILHSVSYMFVHHSLRTNGGLVQYRPRHDEGQ
jgi:hypothetical protein